MSAMFDIFSPLGAAAQPTDYFQKEEPFVKYSLDDSEMAAKRAMGVRYMQQCLSTVTGKPFDVMTRYVALCYFDMFLSERKSPTDPQQIELISQACLNLALTNLKPVDAVDANLLPDSIATMEIEVIRVLGARVKELITPFCFLEHLQKQDIGVTYHRPSYVHWVVLHSAADVELMALKPSQIAGVALTVYVKRQLALDIFTRASRTLAASVGLDDKKFGGIRVKLGMMAAFQHSGDGVSVVSERVVPIEAEEGESTTSQHKSGKMHLHVPVPSWLVSAGKKLGAVRETDKEEEPPLVWGKLLDDDSLKLKGGKDTKDNRVPGDY